MVAKNPKNIIVSLQVFANSPHEGASGCASGPYQRAHRCLWAFFTAYFILVA